MIAIQSRSSSDNNSITIINRSREDYELDGLRYLAQPHLLCRNTVETARSNETPITTSSAGVFSTYYCTSALLLCHMLTRDRGRGNMLLVASCYAAS